jgi:LSD1 subclass zinc finger protein
MKKGKNTAEVLGSDNDFDDIVLSEDEGHERTLILNATPRSRRIQLIAQGAREIRCSLCHQIRPLAGAEESDDGWICEFCIPGA